MPATATDGLKTIRKAWERAEQTQQVRNDIYKRQWERYKGFSASVVDPYRSNLVMPKLYASIETMAPRIAKALFGKRPYIPIRSDKNPEAVKPIEMALDSYLYQDKFKIKAAQMVKAVALFGTSFIEPVPVKKTILEKQVVDSPVFPWLPVKQDVPVDRFRLQTRLYMPWQVYVEPHMTDMDSPGGFVIIVEIVPTDEIRRLVLSGRYPNVDLDLLSGPGEKEGKTFSEDMMKALGIERPADDPDYGVLMRYQGQERYITAWNGTVELEDKSNPHNHKKINLVRCAWNLDPMAQNSFWGQPEGKAAEAILDKLDESWNMTFDNNDIINQAVIGYREEAVEPNQLVWVGGSRIGIKNNFQGSIRDAVDVLETRGLPADAYQIPSVLDREVDRAMGVYAPQRGEPDADKNQTATESSLLASHGDLRNEHRAEMLENLGLADFADKATSHIDQYTQFPDIFEIIGEDALTIMTLNPQQVPGGAHYQFKGSASITEDFQNKADWRADLDVLVGNPAVWQDGIARETLQRQGLNEQEINEIVMPRELYIQLMIGSMMASQGGNGEKPKGKEDSPKRKPAQIPSASQPDGGGR
jgi:hypothetical protein